MRVRVARPVNFNDKHEVRNPKCEANTKLKLPIVKTVNGLPVR